ncbi:MAG: ABC transporter substrate-binding protein [Candidatus Sumerlaeia bacterium]
MLHASRPRKIHLMSVAASLALLLAMTAVKSGAQNQPQPPAAPKAASGDPILFGVAAPFTGSGAEFGDMIWKGAVLAQKQINAAGGINGRPLELDKGDDQGKNDQAVIVANKYVSNPRIVLVIGHFNSTCSLAAKPIYNQHKIVQFSPGSTNVAVCEGGPYTFRNLYRDDYQGEFLAEFAKSEFGAKKAAVFYDNDDYGIGLKNAFVRKAAQIGLELVGEEAYVREQTFDYSTGLDKFAARQPDVIFISGLYNEAAAIVKLARSKGIKAQFLGGDGVDSPGFLKIAGQAAEGTIVTSPFVFTEDNEKAQQMADAFEREFGQAPDTWAALTYDAVMMAAEAVRAVGPDREKVREWMASITTPEKGFKGVTGNTYFDANGDCLKPAYVKIVKDGEFVPYVSRKKAQ